MLNVIS